MRNTTGPIAIQPSILEARLPLGFRRKALGFGIGLAAAIGLNLLVGPRSGVWRSPAVSRPIAPASAAEAPPRAPTSAPVAAPSSVEARPSPVADSPTRVPVADRPMKEVADRPMKKVAAHKASRSAKRHPPKRRTASRR